MHREEEIGMERYIYAGEGPENDAFMEDLKALVEKCRKARKALKDDYATDGLYIEGNEIMGLAFNERKKLPYLKGEVDLGGGYGYLPRKGDKEGKKLANRIEQEKILHFDPAKYIIEKLGVARDSYKGGRWYCSVAGYTTKRVMVKIPGPKDEEFPVVPDWMREITQSECDRLYAEEG